MTGEGGKSYLERTLGVEWMCKHSPRMGTLTFIRTHTRKHSY
jgi:hypothetical protein